MGLSFSAIATIVVILYLFSSIKVLAEYERGVIFRLGRLLGHEKGPGIVLVFAPIDRMVRISLRQEAMEVPPARDIVPQIQALLDVFREKRLPVVFTEFTYSENVPVLVGLLHPEHRRAAPGAPRGFGKPSSSCLLGEANIHVVPELAPQPGELVVRKHYYDGFNGTALDAALRARGATHHQALRALVTQLQNLRP